MNWETARAANIGCGLFLESINAYMRAKQRRTTVYWVLRESRFTLWQAGVSVCLLDYAKMCWFHNLQWWIVIISLPQQYFWLNSVVFVYFTVQAEKEEVSDMVDLHQLTDDQLKARLLQYGVKAGPIVGQSIKLKSFPFKTENKE